MKFTFKKTLSWIGYGIGCGVALCVFLLKSFVILERENLNKLDVINKEIYALAESAYSYEKFRPVYKDLPPISVQNMYAGKTVADELKTPSENRLKSKLAEDIFVSSVLLSNGDSALVYTFKNMFPEYCSALIHRFYNSKTPVKVTILDKQKSKDIFNNLSLKYLEASENISSQEIQELIGDSCNTYVDIEVIDNSNIQ